MKVVGIKHLNEFKRKYADARSAVEAWLAEAEEAQWQTPQDIKARYASASFVAENRVVFNLKGNKYRLLTKVNYKNQVVLILKIGTHREYDTWGI